MDVDVLVLFCILERKLSAFLIQCDVIHGLVLHGLGYVEDVPSIARCSVMKGY
jgi:hypothetical protein